jgi:hypothetical protein
MIFGMAVSFLAASSISMELEAHTFEAWLAQPLSFRRLLAEKLGPVAVLSGLAAAELICGGAPIASPELAGAVCLLAVGLAPLLVMISRNSLVGGIGPWGLAVMVCFTLRPVDSDPALITLLCGWPPAPAWVVLALGAVGGGASLWLVLSLRPTEPATHLQGLRPFGRRSSAVRSQLMKELRLQSPTAMIAGLGGLGWIVGRLSPGMPDHVAAEVWPSFLALMMGPVAGICAVGSERRFGTLHLDVGGAPAAQVWRIKLAATAGVALFLGVLLPSTLLVLQEGLPHGAMDWRRGASTAAMMGVVVLLLAGLGMLISGVVHDFSRAFVATIGAGFALFLSMFWLWSPAYLESGNVSGSTGQLLSMELARRHSLVHGLITGLMFNRTPGRGDGIALRPWAVTLAHMNPGDAMSGRIVVTLGVFLVVFTAWILFRSARRVWLHARFERPWRTALAFGSVAATVIVLSSLTAAANTAAFLERFLRT